MGTGTNSFCLGLAKIFTNFSMIAFTLITSVSFVGFVTDAIGVIIVLVALVLVFFVLRIPQLPAMSSHRSSVVAFATPPLRPRQCTHPRPSARMSQQHASAEGRRAFPPPQFEPRWA